jgi:ATP-dependent DNA helicase RecQ
VGSARKKEEWRSLVRQLVAGGFLHHDAAGFGGLSVLEEGAALLRGEKQFLYRKDAARPRRERAVAASSAVISDAEAELFTVLKKLRLSIAAQRSLPAYLIFSDKTLLEMARCTPRNLQEFAMISGVGTSKLRDFGKAFVDAIAAHRISANVQKRTG